MGDKSRTVQDKCMIRNCSIRIYSYKTNTRYNVVFEKDFGPLFQIKLGSNLKKYTQSIDRQIGNDLIVLPSIFFHKADLPSGEKTQILLYVT